jgi:hypothetical protein
MAKKPADNTPPPKVNALLAPPEEPVDVKLTQLIKRELGKKASINEDLTQEQIDAVAQGHRIPTKAEVLVAKLVRMAIDPNKSNQAAVEMVFDRVEGRPIQAPPPDTGSREVEERLDDLTKQHLNDLAGAFQRGDKKPSDLTEQPASSGPIAATVRAAGPAARLLDLPQDGPGHSQEAGQ